MTEPRLINADCVEAMRRMEPASVDAIVTDPPYELGFMGKGWDSAGVSFRAGTWREAFRVLKPGGHLLAFGGSRTVHRIAVAIEDAGFEIRDQIAWMYGSGFPKSLDVAKQIDKDAGHWRGRAGEVLSENGSMVAPNYERSDKGEPVTADARRWQGWGTALKPAYEPVVVARKPLAGTVAANVLAHGTGALNINGCRTPVGEEQISVPQSNPGNRAGVVGTDLGITGTDTAQFQRAQRESAARTQELGRWPTNVMLDERAAALLDEQTGLSVSQAARMPLPSAPGDARGRGHGDTGESSVRGHDDSGGASRFFYCAKVSGAERDAGLEAFEERSFGWSSGAQGALARGEEYDIGDGGFNMTTTRRNVHPTVKPVEVMRWLVRLVTPPGGTVLDPFLGSGSTGIAAGLEGFGFVGIEREPEYIRIAEARIGFWGRHGEDTLEVVARQQTGERRRAEAAEAGQMDLFG